ncbi:MAG TPA: hypothetical protein VIF14_17285 [Alphaproteobacteria bacterium]|jgi:hypothetical protein
MRSHNAIVDGKTDTFECLGPVALKLVALLAVLAVFAPLVAAFAALFIG